MNLQYMVGCPGPLHIVRLNGKNFSDLKKEQVDFFIENFQSNLNNEKNFYARNCCFRAFSSVNLFVCAPVTGLKKKKIAVFSWVKLCILYHDKH